VAWIRERQRVDQVFARLVEESRAALGAIRGL